MSVFGRIDAYQRRHRWLGFPLAVLYKFFDDQGNHLTALLTYYGFLSLFPLLLLLVTVLGFVLQDNPDLQQKVLDSALNQFPVIGEQIGTNIGSLRGSALALVVAVLVSLYGGLGAAQATQAALNKVWGVPRGTRPNPVKARLRSLLMLLIAGGGIAITTVLSALVTATRTYGADLGTGARLGAAVLAVAVNVALFTLAFRVLTAGSVSIRQVRGGAIAAGLIWQTLQWTATAILGHVLSTASATYGAFALVLGMLAWIYLGALTVVLCAEANVVHAERLWPRSLLAPFTDRAELTPADRRAYQSYANTERHKSTEHITVTFDQPPHTAPSTKPHDTL